MSLASPSSSSDLSRIIQLCSDGSCILNLEEESYIQSTEYQDSLNKYLSSGVSQFLWDFVRTDLREGRSSVGLSPPCLHSLIQASKGLESQASSEYRKLVSSTGRTPEKIFTASITSLGDYDTCLSIQESDSSSFNGKYCLVDLFPARNPPEKNIPNFFYDEILNRSFQNLSFFQGVCLPDSCDSNDVRVLMQRSLKPILLKPNGFIDCDTKQSTSYFTRAINMSWHQIISLLVITSVITLAGVATTFHSRKLLVTGQPIKSLDSCIESLADPGQDFISQNFSILSNFMKLFKASSQQDSRYILLDVFKMSMLVVVCSSHALMCIEIPAGNLLLAGHQLIRDTVGSPSLQFLMGDSGIVMFAYLGGFTTFIMLYPIMKKMKAENKPFPFAFAIFDRWLRFTPSIMCLVCLEFLWPLLFDGPFFSRVGSFVHDKCQRTWFLNLFYIQNWFPVLDICAGQTFFSAVDMQLFILGLFVISILVKSQKQGIAVAITLSFIAYIKVVYNGFVYESTMTLYTPQLIPIKILEYLDYIHMTTPAYIPSYLMGIMNGLLIHSGFKLPVKTVQQHLAIVTLGFFLPGGPSVVKILYNTFDILPNLFVPFAIMGDRLIQCLAVGLNLTYYMSINMNWLTNVPLDSSKNGEKKKQSYSIIQGICRLSYSLYLINYFVVKSEFFTTRNVLSLTWYSILSRLLSSFIIMILAAVIFHLLFVAPFDNLRKTFISKLRKCDPSSSVHDFNQNVVREEKMGEKKNL